MAARLPGESHENVVARSHLEISIGKSGDYNFVPQNFNYSYSETCPQRSQRARKWNMSTL